MSPEEYIKIVLRYNCIPTKMSKVQKTVNTKCWQECRTMRMLQMLLGIQNDAVTLDDRFSFNCILLPTTI